MKIFLIIYFAVFISELYPQTERIQYSPYSDTLINNTSLTADSVYSFILSNEHLIDFYDCNICKSRAHIICRAIEKQFPGAVVLKAWLITDSKRLSQKDKYRYKQNVYLKYGSCTNWVYHVAPALLINGDTVVIDPSTQKSAVSLSKWADQIIPAGGKGFMIIKKNTYYLYPESSDDYFLDELAVWDAAEKRMKDEKYLRSIDEILKAKQGFYEPWKFNYYMSELLKLVE